MCVPLSLLVLFAFNRRLALASLLLARRALRTRVSLLWRRGREGNSGWHVAVFISKSRKGGGGKSKRKRSIERVRETRHTLKIQLFNNVFEAHVHLLRWSVRLVACHDAKFFSPRLRNCFRKFSPGCTTAVGKYSRNSHGGRPISEPFTGRVEF